MDRPNCCCSWGAAVGGRGLGGPEYPEFGCALCPVHEAALGETELCRRHRARTFVCGWCHGTFHTHKPVAEVDAEATARFGAPIPDEEAVSVCDECDKVVQALWAQMQAEGRA